MAVLAGLLLLNFWTNPAGAQERGREPALNWVRMEGAEACITAAQLAHRVEERLQRVVFVAPSEANLFVDGTVAQESAGFHVRLQLSASDGTIHGERNLAFHGSDCAVIDEAVVLVIAVTLYPDSALGVPGIPLDAELSAQLTEMFGQEPSVPDVRLAEPAPKPEPESAAATELTDEAREEVKDSHSAQPGPATPFGFAPFLALGGGLGILPGLGLLGTVGVDISPSEALRIELSFAAAPKQTVSLQGGRVQFGWAQGAVSLCPWRLWAEDTDLCAGAELGMLSARAQGYPEQTAAQRDLLLNGRIGAVYRPQLWGLLQLRLAVSAAVRILTRAYEVQGLSGQNETAFRTGPLTARAEIGLSLSF